jgi:hypothetical protein
MPPLNGYNTKMQARAITLRAISSSWPTIKVGIMTTNCHRVNIKKFHNQNNLEVAVGHTIRHCTITQKVSKTKNNRWGRVVSS